MYFLRDNIFSCNAYIQTYFTQNIVKQPDID